MNPAILSHRKNASVKAFPDFGKVNYFALGVQRYSHLNIYAEAQESNEASLLCELSRLNPNMYFWLSENQDMIHGIYIKDGNKKNPAI